RALRLLERLLRGVIRRLLGASDQLDDLYDGHEASSTSAMVFAVGVLFECATQGKSAICGSLNAPSAGELRASRDALPERGFLPAAPRRLLGCRSRLPEEALECRGDRSRLL